MTMSYPMRRKNQALPPPACDAILARGTSGVLALAGEDGPYAVPLSYVYHKEAGALYFHCAPEGRKLLAMAREPRASFCVIGEDAVVPERFTTRYRSVIAFGRMRRLTDPAEKRAALRLLAEKYSPDASEEARRAEIDGSFDRVVLLALDIEALSGKESRELAAERRREEEAASLPPAEARKARSMALLEREGIPAIPHLPCIEEEGRARIRSAEEILRRAGCLFLTCLCIWNIEEEAGSIEKATRDIKEDCGEHYRRAAEGWGLLDDLSDNEWAVLDGRADRRLMLAMSWRFEAFRVLAWALGMGPELDLPRQQFDGNPEDFFPSLEPSAFGEFRRRARRRAEGEILDQADLIYRIRWALVDAQLKGRQPPAGLDGDIAVERHTALNWLIGYGGEDWDHIRVDT